MTARFKADGEIHDEYSITLKDPVINELFPNERSLYSNSITAFHSMQDMLNNTQSIALSLKTACSFSVLTVSFLLISGCNQIDYKTNIKIVAHRGAMIERLENTMAAFKKAHELGADIVEVDLYISKDGQLFIFHDSSLDRTTNDQGATTATSHFISRPLSSIQAQIVTLDLFHNSRENLKRLLSAVS